MLIVGAKGFAKEVLEVLNQRDNIENLFFFDDVSTDLPNQLYGRFPVITSLEAAAKLFQTDPRFVLGIGSPHVRKLLTDKMRSAGGVLESTISPKAAIGSFGNTVGGGANVMTGVVITNDVTIGEAVLINLNCTIGHDVVIGAYSELSPGVHVSGHVTLGAGVTIGTGAVLLPGVSIGENSVVGAGAVVNKDVESNSVAVGIPAKVIKKLT